MWMWTCPWARLWASPGCPARASPPRLSKAAWTLCLLCLMPLAPAPHGVDHRLQAISTLCQGIFRPGRYLGIDSTLQQAAFLHPPKLGGQDATIQTELKSLCQAYKSQGYRSDSTSHTLFLRKKPPPDAMFCVRGRGSVFAGLLAVRPYLRSSAAQSGLAIRLTQTS